jgi:aspartate-semialdehyde dehydrogenase
MQQKIPVGILGATGSVGQKFVELLQHHPWFEVTALAASERSVGKTYVEAANWFSGVSLEKSLADMVVSPCEPTLPCRIVFSGLDSSVAGEIETAFAKAGYIVVSNSKNHRMDADVPLLVPDVNPEVLALVKSQGYDNGMIVTNPNCTTVGLVMALKPLVDAFGVERVMVTTMQALSGAGYPGVSSLDIVDNVVPFISGEEEKVETEPAKILGVPMKISAHCNRVAVIDGHTECVSVKLKQPATHEAIIAAWREYRSAPQALDLPMAPTFPLRYFDEERYPQPRLHRNFDKGMVTSIGRLRPCALLDWKFVLMSHNTIRGAAGGAILNAELMVKKGLV